MNWFAFETLPIYVLDRFKAKSLSPPKDVSGANPQAFSEVVPITYEQTEHARRKREYLSAIEYPRSKIFVALRDGTLTATGRQLKGADVGHALEALKERNINISDIEVTAIPPAFWSLQLIDFRTSTASKGNVHYYDVSCPTHEMLSIFKVDETEVRGVYRMGDFLMWAPDDSVEINPRPTRGRPSFNWEQFHVEVAAMVESGELPAKKEAAIAHFQSWFDAKMGFRPSRAAIGEKLKPYYDRFLRK